MARFERILVPVDGSEGSDHACAFAAELATATGAAITVLHVVELTATDAMGMRALDRGEFDAKIAELARIPLKRAAEAMGSPQKPIRLDEVVVVGHPADEILTFARQHSPSLIVMGSRGRGPLQGLLLGSVGETVMRRATCPVMVTR